MKPKVATDSWRQFIRFLETEVDWEDFWQTHEPLEKELRRLSLDRAVIAERIRSLSADGSLEYLLPHMEYPRPVMDKFLLHMDTGDRFRIRIHRFKSQEANRGIQPTIHDHRWHYSTIVLAGGYAEEIFGIETTEGGAKDVKVLRRHLLAVNVTNSLPPRVPHRTTNSSADEDCITLFIRGRSEYLTSRVYDSRERRFRELYGRPIRIATELSKISNLIV